MAELLAMIEAAGLLPTKLKNGGYAAAVSLLRAAARTAASCRGSASTACSIRRSSRSDELCRCRYRRVHLRLMRAFRDIAIATEHADLRMRLVERPG